MKAPQTTRLAFKITGHPRLTASLNRAVEDRGRPIRLPVNGAEELRRVLGVRGRLEQELGREPTLAELGALTALSPERMHELLTWLPRPASLDAASQDEHDLSLAERIADREASDPAVAAESGEAQSGLRQALGSLDERERQVLELRFGLGGGDDLTLAEVGERLGLSRERVRQLEILAIKKLRTRTSMVRRTAAGLSKPEIIRCLRRYLARELYRILTAPPASPLLTAHSDEAASADQTRGNLLHA